jgi:hypothetical protein
MRLEILPLPCEYIFTLMNFVINNREHFRQTQQYIVLTLGIGTIFTDQLLAFHVLKKLHTMLHQNLQQSTINSQKSQE